MSTDKEKFRGLCMEVSPLINGIVEAVKRSGYESMASLTMHGDDYFTFSVYDTGWKMEKVNGGPVKMRYEYEEEIELRNWRQEKMTYNKASENLVEISLVYAGMQAEYGKLRNIDSITWKQKFVDWANEFEEMYPDKELWKDGGYLECINAFARRKICEYVEIGE